jgi:zinc transport system permease protein
VEWVLTQFVTPPFLGGVSLSLVAGPLGAFLVWHRLSYVADAFAHAAILGLVVGAGLGIPQGVSMVVFALLSGAVMWALLSYFKLMEDTLLVLFSGGAMSLGLFLMAVFEVPRTRVMGYLAGNMMTVSYLESAAIILLSVCVIAFLVFRSRMLLSAIVCPDFARVEGLPVNLVYGGFLSVVFLFVLLGLKWAGSLFMTVCLICPIVMVSSWVVTPAQALIQSALWSVACFVCGFYVATLYGAPLGATVGLVMVLGALTSGGMRFMVRARQRRMRESTT